MQWKIKRRLTCIGQNVAQKNSIFSEIWGIYRIEVASEVEIFAISVIIELYLQKEYL